MKSPKEYLNKVSALTTREELYKIGRQMQIDAYNEALEHADNKLPKEILDYIDLHDYSAGVEYVENVYKEYILNLKLTE